MRVRGGLCGLAALARCKSPQRGAEASIGFSAPPVARTSEKATSTAVFVSIEPYMATDLDLGQREVSHETMVYRSWDHDETYYKILAGEPAAFGVNVPTMTDPSLAPPGEHTVVVFTPIPYDVGASWRQEKAHYMELLTDALEAVIPGVHDHLTFAEGASPRTMERYTLNLTGALYGWENSPEQFGRGRLGHRTPVDGLLLSGQWTQPGAGIYGVVLSGLQTAGLLLGYDSGVDFVRSWTVPN